MQTGPWPHYNRQTEAKNHGTRILWMEPDEIYISVREHYPRGCYIMFYSGGGLHAIYQPEEAGRFQSDCLEAIEHPSRFWSRVAGYDIDAPRIPRAQSAAPTGRATGKSNGPTLSLSDIGL